MSPLPPNLSIKGQWRNLRTSILLIQRLGSAIGLTRTSVRVAQAVLLFKIVHATLLIGGIALESYSQDSGNSRPFGIAVRQRLLSFDGDYYVSLSRNGYHKDSDECAFYPLYPLVIKLVSTVDGGHNLLVGLILSNILSFCALILFYNLAAHRFGAMAAKWALIVLISFPGSLFFQLIYSESLFFLLLMFFCWFVEKRSYLLLSGVSFLLPLTRAVGIFCVLPLLWTYIGSPRWDKGRFSRTHPKGLVPVYVLIAPIAGWATYLILMYSWTGNAFEGFAAQKHFGLESISNLFRPFHFAFELLNPTDWHATQGSLLDRCVFLVILEFLPLIWKMDIGWFCWTLCLGIVPAITGEFTSLTRFTSVVFPVFIASGAILSKPELCLLRWGVMLTLVALHVILMWRFISFNWVG